VEMTSADCAFSQRHDCSKLPLRALGIAIVNTLRVKLDAITSNRDTGGIRAALVKGSLCAD
jgi:hypothetical protein